MQLLTQELRQKFPPLYSNEDKPPEQVKIIAKFFTPDSNWTWYPTEFDGKDLFFGYVRGHVGELGYFSLKELETTTGPWGLHIERDKFFGENHTLAEVMEKAI